VLDHEVANNVLRVSVYIVELTRPSQTLMLVTKVPAHCPWISISVNIFG
tara:strand:+ start:228 stop:374 length:147 start_codon:yes stop_codon:yes gene_type:complete